MAIICGMVYLSTILQASDITVHQVLYNGYPGETTTWSTFVNATAARGLTIEPVQFPATLAWGGMTAHILNPEPGFTNPETNEASLVTRVDYGATNYLMTGDINSTIEATVVARGTPVASEVLKVAHHGSAYSSSPDFLFMVAPQLAVIEVGPNDYGHPSPETLTRLVASGSHVDRTDQSGTISVSSDGNTITIIHSLDHL